MRIKGLILKSIYIVLLLVTILGIMLFNNSKVMAAPSDVNGFITRFYEQCLSREPDNSGLNYWANRLNTNISTGADVANNFIFSPEFLNRNVSDDQFMNIMYIAFFNRQSDADGKNYWMSKLSNGISRLYVLSSFVNSTEFNNVCTGFGIIRGSIYLSKPADLHPNVAAFTYRFYDRCLGRKPDDSGLNYWVSNLISGKNTGADLSLGFVFSQEFLNKNLTNTDFGTILYRVFFDREGDSAGLSYWNNILISGYSRRYVLGSFVSSQEFKNLCSGYGITTGNISITSADLPDYEMMKHKIYKLNEEAPIIVDGKQLGTLTINKVSTMEERNPYSDKNPAQVILIEYTYKNTGDPEQMYIFSYNFQIIDGGNSVCETYPNIISKYPKDTPIGAKCTAQEVFGLENVSSFVKLNFYYNIFDNEPTIKFELPIS